MKIFRYLFLVCLTWMILGSCKEEYVYNTRVVTGFELLGTEEEGNLLFSRGEEGEIKVKIMPVDAINKKDYISFSYRSSDEGVFTVDNVGKIRALAAGEATLTVQSINNPAVSRSYKVVVQPNWVRTIELPQEYKQCNLLIDFVLDLGNAIVVKPEHADNQAVIYTSSNPDIATVDKDGIVRGVAKGEAEIVIQAVDEGKAMTSAFVTVIDELVGDFPRGAWTVTASHKFVPDEKGGGDPEKLLDGSYNTFLSIRKPGKGDETPEGDNIFFTIDMHQQYPFNYFRWHNRGDNPSVGLRCSKVDIYGSLDGEDFELIQSGIALDTGVNGSTGEKVLLENTVSYRYVRFMITGYSTSAGSAIQFSEIHIGKE